MRSLRTLILKNATSNVVRGLATAAVALTLPHFLTRSLDPGRFAAWSLILQISSYASFLDFGLQTAVARFLAQAVEADDERRRDTLVSTSLLMLSGAAMVALTLVVLVIGNSTHLFPGIPVMLLGEFREAAWVLAFSSCALLPLSTYTGVLLGLHRNEFPALSIGVSRVAGALLVVLAVRFTHSLVVLSGLIGVANLLGGFSQFVAVHRLLPSLRVTWRVAQRAVAAELARYCAGLSLWALGMLLVSGLDVTVVGHFRFAAVGVYSVAATLSMFFAGLNQSLVGALMTPIAAMHARGQSREIALLVLRVTRLNALGNFTLVLLLLAGGPWLLRVWVGAAYAQAAFPLLAVLLVAQAIRLVANPYGVMLVAAGQQSQALAPVLAEALVNLAASLAGIVLLGPIGVAEGTLAGAGAGFGLLLLHTAPRLAAELKIGTRDLVREGLLRPLRAVLPLAGLLAVSLVLGRGLLPLSGLGVALTAGLAWVNERKRPLAHAGEAAVLSPAA